MSTLDKPLTRGQRRAHAACECVREVEKNGDKEYSGKYLTFARKFPSLIQSCGLVQAVAFALARSKAANDIGAANEKKGPYEEVVKALAKIMGLSSLEKLQSDCQLAEVPEYLRLSRDALDAANWLKRYAEALLGDVS